ncbi:hypothetical protein H6F96_24475 [Microcoleus sp. FACHB-53]|nr:hypothetical protein [Microcoleus sp. FACHB-53]
MPNASNCSVLECFATELKATSLPTLLDIVPLNIYKRCRNSTLIFPLTPPQSELWNTAIGFTGQTVAVTVAIATPRMNRLVFSGHRQTLS